MIIAVDFDGTICRHEYPEIGPENLVIISILNALRAHGNKLILWTCRDGEDLRKAVEWCAARGLQFDAINEDIPEIKDSEFGRTKSRKVYADVYLDDRNLTLQYCALLLGQKG